jgi:thioredoxin 1
MITTVSPKNFTQIVLESQTPVLVDFWSAHCPPCRLLAPILEQVSTTLKERLAVVKFSVDSVAGEDSAAAEEKFALVMRYGITNLPTMLLFVEGAVRAILPGLRGKDELLAALAPCLKP